MKRQGLSWPSKNMLQASIAMRMWQTYSMNMATKAHLVDYSIKRPYAGFSGTKYILDKLNTKKRRTTRKADAHSQPLFSGLKASMNLSLMRSFLPVVRQLAQNAIGTNKLGINTTRTFCVV